jgi:hypothetical protein
MMGHLIAILSSAAVGHLAAVRPGTIRDPVGQTSTPTTSPPPAALADVTAAAIRVWVHPGHPRWPTGRTWAAAVRALDVPRTEAKTRRHARR